VFVAEADGWRVVCTDTALSLDRLADPADPQFGVGGLGRHECPDPFSAELSAGMWLQLPEILCFRTAH
jgi:hypothetical protein